MQFSYKALKNNKVTRGTLNAESQEAVLRFLKTSDYFPIEIRRSDGTNSYLDFLNKANFSDIVNLTRQLAIMLNAGMTLIDAVDLLKGQANKPPIQDLLINIDKEIKAGNNFSYALQKYPQYFSNFYVALVKSGEASGKLSDILLRLADNLEKQRIFRGKIKGAMVYPVIVLIAIVVVMFIMITFVIPKLLDLYKDIQVELPIYTRVLIVVSDFFSKFWVIVIGIVASGYLLLKRYLHSSAGKQVFDRLILKLPIFSNVIKMSVLVDTTRTLAILLSSVVSLLEGLSIICNLTTNSIYREVFKTIRKQVEKGVSLGTAMKEAGIFPPILVQMTIVGEETGHLDETLLRISNYFEIESEMAVKTLTTLIEPAILVFLGVAVAFLVFSIIAPIYSLTSAIK